MRTVEMIEIPAQGMLRYILGCCLTQQKLYEDAYIELSRLIALCDPPVNEAYKLRAYVGFNKMSPPRYEQGLLDMFHLLAIYPNDLDLVSRVIYVNTLLFATLIR
jgi:hypothetical protein